MIEGATNQELVLMALFCVGLAAVPIAPITIALRYFVALQAPPTVRAAWTAGIAYLGTTVFWLFGGPVDTQYWAPLIALPGGVIAFLFWRSDFRRGWIEDVEHMPEGVELANDDWAAGLVRLLGLVAAATIAALIRMYVKSD